MSELKPNPSPFRFENFLIKESHFVMPSEQEEINFSISVLPKGIYDKKTQSFVLELEVILEKEDKQPFIKINCSADFSFKEANEENISRYFLVNAPAIVFPYIRAYISSLTAQSGLASLNLPTYNLSGLSDVLKDNIHII